MGMARLALQSGSADPEKYIKPDGTEATLSGSRTVYGYSVYVGDSNDASILSNRVARYTQSTQTTGDLTATISGSNTVGKYVLIVFDYMATDPGTYNDSAWGDADTKCQTSTMTGYNSSSIDGGIYVSELALEGAPLLVVGDESKGNVEIDGIGDDGIATVTVTPDEGEVLKTGTLTYTVNGNTYPITIRKDAVKNGAHDYDNENQCTTFQFKMPTNQGTVTVDAALTSVGDQNMAVLGASINSTVTDGKVRMRFHSRVAQTYVKDGTTYTVKEMGTVLKNVSTGTEKTVTTTKLYDRCDDYYEYVCVLNLTADGNYLGTEYTATAYVVYEAEGCEDVTFTSEGVTRSYNGIVAKLG